MQDQGYTTEDLEALDRLLISPGYAVLLRLADAELERRRTELEQELDQEKTAFVRGQIAQLRLFPDLAPIARAEIAALLKEE